MQPQSSETVSAAKAREALAWATRVAIDPESAGPAPERPSAAEWGALSVAELRAPLDELLVQRNVEEGLQALQELGALAVWLPELEAMVGFGDGEWRHKDVWKHTKQVVKQSVPRLEVRWGALLHDIGKPKTRKITDDGQVTFYGHSEVGAAMFRRKVKKRLGFEGALSDRVHFLILHHLRASQYETSWTDAAVRRFYKQMGEGLRDLLDLSRADITTKRPEKRRRGVAQISALSKRIKALEAVDSKVAPLPKGLGQALMSELGLPPGKQLGEIRKKLEDEADEGLIEAGREADYYVALVKGDRGRYGA
jgi:poly(A) polymerase